MPLLDPGGLTFRGLRRGCSAIVIARLIVLGRLGECIGRVAGIPNWEANEKPTRKSSEFGEITLVRVAIATCPDLNLPKCPLTAAS
jgi:hypothetical protein